MAPPSSQTPYRIALVVDELKVHEWVRELADWASAHPGFDLAAIIIHSPGGGLWDRLFALETRLLSPGKAHRSYARRYSLAGRAPVELLSKRGAAISSRFELDPADLATLRGLKVDALVRCGRGMPASDIVGCAKDGMVSMSVGAGPPGSAAAGFLEVLEGRPDTRFAIERTRSEGQLAQTLFSGSVATELFYGSSLISLYARAFPYLQLTLERLAEGTALSSSNLPQNQWKEVGLGDLVTYGRRSAKRSLTKAVRRFSGKEFNWQVGFIRQPWSSHRWSGGEIIPNPRGAFLADPFTICVDGVQYIFAEEYSFAVRKGVICAYRIEGSEARRIGVVLEEPHHLSFPFLFSVDGEIYMVPESGEDRSVKIYKATNFPFGWSQARVLLKDVPAVDTVLFRDGPLWWMLTTIQGKGPGLNNAELHAFHAPDPFGDWTPHRKNPVVMDASKGRNGGFLRDECGRPCRVAQVPGFTFYGAGSAIYRIDEITPDTYRESPLHEVRPTFFPKLDGTHHIHSADGLTVFDFMRVERPARRARRAYGEERPTGDSATLAKGPETGAWSET